MFPAERNRAGAEAERTGSPTSFRLKHEFGRAIGDLGKHVRNGPSGMVTIDHDAVSRIAASLVRDGEPFLCDGGTTQSRSSDICDRGRPSESRSRSTYPGNLCEQLT